MKLPSRKTVLIYAAAIATVLTMIGIIIGVRKVVAEGALTTPPPLKPWVYGCGLATMWGTVAASQVAKRTKVFQDEGRLRQWTRVILNFAAVAAVAAGFFAALFNLPGEGNVMLRMTLYMATTASGVITFRLAVF
ncbi:MAG: hypothetical protein JSU81_03530 [Candidatus Coatesbacteria bacterium]|nr:MAG: hypothetical protein JSU81_03530 [Candidatus Coatesbacteria bacterium]